ncbi:MAG: PspA-associated protein PspAB [Gaiellaceae bacterium]
MGLADVLFGRKKLKGPAGERLFAISTARITLETELDLKPAGAAGVCFKSLSAGEFVRAENDLQQLLDAVATESGSKVERRSDEYGYEWLIVHDSGFEDLVATVHTVASELEARGFGAQLLAAVFPFEGKGFDGRRVYWIYGFKRGAFWPFVPKGDGKERDNAEELELKAKLEQELPIEQDLSRWFAVFDAPL